MISLDLTDTIAAVASPPGAGFRGIVRLSGPDAWPVALTRFLSDSIEGGWPPDRPARVGGRYRLDGLRSELPAALLLWPGPRTYTGQALAEVHTVGAPPLVEHLLAHCLAHGARLAEPGEFTLRAFLSGRIDLTRAEAVLGVIDARGPAQLDAALRQLAGGVFTPIAALRDRLLDALAHLEANLDFVDESDVDPLGRDELAEVLTRGAADLAALSDRLRGRDRPDGSPRVVLIGPPNAGKSRLFNALLGDARAIVSSRPGTTRDYLAAPCACDGLTIELIDTAGAEAARDPIEACAQALRDDQAASAELLLECMPADVARDGDDPESWPILAPDRPRLHVWTKSDLAPSAPAPPGTLATSAATGVGLDALRREVAVRLRNRLDEGDLPATTGARCRDSLARAGEALADALATLRLGGGDELLAVDLRLALDELGKVVGAIVTDDILDRIFQRFCIGK